MVKKNKNQNSKIMQILSTNDCIDYMKSIRFMENRVNKIIKNKEPELIWLLFHPKIYTYGNTSNKNDFIKKPLIPVYKTNRGGQITYHGPGQRIIYYMINLNNRKKDIRNFINKIEKIAIDTLYELGVVCESRDDRIGIWVTKVNGRKLKKEKKIGSIGIKIKKWITYHGLSININTDLRYFDLINPCGITNYDVTSLKALGINIDIKKFDKILLSKSTKYLKI